MTEEQSKALDELALKLHDGNLAGSSSAMELCKPIYLCQDCTHYSNSKHAHCRTYRPWHLACLSLRLSNGDEYYKHTELPWAEADSYCPF